MLKNLPYLTIINICNYLDHYEKIILSFTCKYINSVLKKILKKEIKFLKYTCSDKYKKFNLIEDDDHKKKEKFINSLSDFSLLTLNFSNIKEINLKVNNTVLDFKFFKIPYVTLKGLNIKVKNLNCKDLCLKKCNVVFEKIINISSLRLENSAKVKFLKKITPNNLFISEIFYSSCNFENIVSNIYNIEIYNIKTGDLSKILKSFNIEKILVIRIILNYIYDEFLFDFLSNFKIIYSDSDNDYNNYSYLEIKAVKYNYIDSYDILLTDSVSHKYKCKAGISTNKFILSERIKNIFFIMEIKRYEPLSSLIKTRKNNNIILSGSVKIFKNEEFLLSFETHEIDNILNFFDFKKNKELKEILVLYINKFILNKPEYERYFFPINNPSKIKYIL